MYICLCNPITESQVRRCVREGARSLSDLRATLGVAANCGMCATVAVSIVADECGRCTEGPRERSAVSAAA